MPYPVRFSNTAAGQFRKLKDRKLRERIASALEHVAGKPLTGKPLQAELKGCYSYRVGDYRLLYSFDKKRKYIGVIRIDHRREVYR